jgi:hypothetical protein
MTPSRNTEVDLFLSRHLVPPPGRTASDVKQRILHWITIANNPTSAVAPDSSKKTRADVRRKARQNIVRLMKRHPEAAAAINIEPQSKVGR